MTKEQQEAKRKAEVMLAFAEGRKIEFSDLEKGNEWVGISDPQWSWGVCDYRIKPSEPRRCEARYVANDKSPWGMAYCAGERPYKSDETVQLIELTPEVIEALRVAGITYEGSEPSQEHES